MYNTVYIAEDRKGLPNIVVVCFGAEMEIRDMLQALLVVDFNIEIGIRKALRVS